MRVNLKQGKCWKTEVLTVPLLWWNKIDDRLSVQDPKDSNSQFKLKAWAVYRERKTTHISLTLILLASSEVRSCLSSANVMTQNDGLMWVSHTKVRSGQSLQTRLHLFFSPSSLYLYRLLRSDCGRLFLFLGSFSLLSVCFPYLSPLLPLIILSVPLTVGHTLIYFSELSETSVGIPSAINALNIALIPDLKSFSGYPSPGRILHSNT